MPKDTPPQPKDAVGGSDDDETEQKPKTAPSPASMKVDGASGPVLGVIALEPASGKWKKRTPKQRDHRAARAAVRAAHDRRAGRLDGVVPELRHRSFTTCSRRRRASAFDLGIYKNGESRDVTFDKEGIIRLGCNLHANMAAYVVVVAAPHYVVTDASGGFSSAACRPASTS